MELVPIDLGEPETTNDAKDFDENDEHREKELGFRPQRELVYNKLLPYCSEIDKESNHALQLIKYNLPRSVLAKELRPGVTHWTKQLRTYIRLYGLKFSKEDHVLFIKLYLELLAIPNVEGSLVDVFLSILVVLLKRKKLLSPSDLVIEWQPLYALAKRIVFSKMAEYGLEWFPSIENNLKTVIVLSSPYFPLSATQEMLDEFKPLLCPYDVTVNDGFKLLAWFLPTIALTEEQRNKSWRLWFDEFFKVWESMHNGPPCEFRLIVLFSKVALHNIGYINWVPHCRKIFTRLLRVFKLPVGKSNSKSMVNIPSSSVQDAIPRWIIAMLGGPHSYIVMDHIERMFKAIESYYYPSNHGLWTIDLLNLVSSLAFKFVYRIKKERYAKESWEGKTLESHRLKDDEITRFVLILKPIVFLAMFSKFGYASASRAIQLLSTVRPELILPELLEKSYIALETLTEPHQLKGCLDSLISSMRPLTQYSKWYTEGQSHIIPILYRALPTIDSNDMPKSMTGIAFISTCFSLIPIVDCSEMINDHPDLPENIRNLCLATAELPEIVMQFVDRLFSVVESFNQEHSTRAVESGNDEELKWSQKESAIMTGFGSAIGVILIQASDEIFNQLSDKIFRFVSSRILSSSSARGAIMHICAAVAKSKPEAAARKFIPHFTREILAIVEDNPLVCEEDKVDSQLHWNLIVLSGICKHSGEFALEFKEDLMHVLEVTLTSKAKLAYQQAAMLLRHLLINHSSFYQADYCSVTPTDKRKDIPVYNWGKCTSPLEAEMSWHVPSESEIRFCFELLEKFLFTRLDLLESFCNGGQDLSKDELLRILTVITDITIGAAQVIPNASEKEVEISGRNEVSNLISWKIKTISYMEQYNKVLDEKGNDILNLRLNLFNTVRKTLWKVMETKGDDVKSIGKIISLYSECLLFHENYKTEFEKHWSATMAGKRAMRDLMRGGKLLQRILIVDQALLQHQLRTLVYNRTQYTEIMHNAMIDLLKLSMSHYSAVRVEAQRIFNRGLSLAPYKSVQYFLPPVLGALEKDPVQDHKMMKGALYLLLGGDSPAFSGKTNLEVLLKNSYGTGAPKTSSYLAYFHNWDVVSQTWPAIVRAMRSDRPSIVKLYDKISAKIQTTYNTLAIKIEVNDRSLSAAQQLLDSSSHPTVEKVVLQGIEDNVQKQSEENLRLYNKLTNEFLSLLETGTLSRLQRKFIFNGLNFIIRWDVPVHPAIAWHITSGLVDDMVMFRQISLQVATSILKAQERKRKVVYKTAEEISGVPSADLPARPGDRLDNKFMQYSLSELPTTAEKYDSRIFIEKTHWGYYQWPKKLKTYALHDNSYKLDRTRDEMSGDEREVFDRICDSDFVKQLLKYNSLENIKGRDKYDSKRVDFFKGLFRNFGDSILPIFRVEIEQLAKDTHESTQRCVAEFIAGLVIGSKHWNFEKVDAMWQWLLPILETTRDNISVETMRDWFEAYGHIAQNRDPNKLHWFLKFLVKDPVNGKGGSFMGASRLSLLVAGIRQQEWRVGELLHQILTDIEPMLDHQYKIVRDKMGSLLSSIFAFDISLIGDREYFSPRRETFINDVFQRLSPLMKEGSSCIAVKSSDVGIKPVSSAAPDFPMFEIPADVVMSEAAPTSIDIGATMETAIPDNVMSSLQQGLQKILSSNAFVGQDKQVVLKQIFHQQRQFLPPGVTEDTLKNLALGRRMSSSKGEIAMREEIESSLDDSVLTVDKERNSAVRLLKTLMKFIFTGQLTNLQPTTPCIWKLLPLICKMSPVDSQGPDEELHHDTRASLSCLAQSYTPPDQLRLVVDIVKQISEMTSWHARLTVLNFSQIFIFNNLFTLQEQYGCVTILMDVILKLIADEQLEVREMAMKTLGGLLQCGFMEMDDKIKDFIDKNCKIRIKRKKKEKEEDVSKADYLSKVRNRHAGVLALSACILCSPYTIPEHLPDLLMKLSDHLHDPQPIEGTVKKTFSEFRRTHHDSWHLDKLKFTSDQLSILTDLLVSPCYYA